MGFRSLKSYVLKFSMRIKITQIVIAFIVGILVYFIYDYNIIKHYKNANAKLKCHYMAYACGECFAKYKIVGVENSDNFKSSELVKKDLQVQFASKEMENRLDSLVSKCAICYDFTFEGKLSKSDNSSFFIMKLEAFQVQLMDSSCCD